jgi:hypothetical protein
VAPPTQVCACHPAVSTPCAATGGPTIGASTCGGNAPPVRCRLSDRDDTLAGLSVAGRPLHQLLPTGVAARPERQRVCGGPARALLPRLPVR